MTGSKALSSNCPASTAIVTVVSLPQTAKATWLTTSGITGLIFPGIIEDPACLTGKLISPIPVCGPEDINLKSLEIFESETAKVFKIDEAYKNPSKFCVPSTKSSACFKSRPVTSFNTFTISFTYVASALRPVPIAVAPRFTLDKASIAFSILL